MMRRHPGLRGGAACALGCLAVHAASAQSLRNFSVSRPIGSERALHVTLDYSGGTLVLAPAASGELYRLDVRYDPDRASPTQQYDARTGVLRLGVESRAGIGVQVSSRNTPTQFGRVSFAATLPLSLDASLGAGESTLDLGAMTLSELAVHSTGNKAVVDFSRPTLGECRTATFSVAAAELEVRHLASSGCSTVSVDGGVGAVTLGLDGSWRRDIGLTVDLSMGRLTLRVPRGTGVRLTADRFLAPFDASGFVHAGDTWTTPGFDDAARKIRVDLKAAMVAIDVVWIDR